MLRRCLGCQYTSDTSTGIANHRRRCQAHKAVAAHALRTRLGDLRRNEQEDRAGQAAVHLAEEQIEMEVDVDLQQPEVSLYRLAFQYCNINAPRLCCVAYP
jgi:hypothetical protein